MKFCKQCGFTYPDFENRCPRCGLPFDNPNNWVPGNPSYNERSVHARINQYPNGNFSNGKRQAVAGSDSYPIKNPYAQKTRAGKKSKIAIIVLSISNGILLVALITTIILLATKGDTKPNNTGDDGNGSSTTIQTEAVMDTRSQLIGNWIYKSSGNANGIPTIYNGVELQVALMTCVGYEGLYLYSDGTFQLGEGAGSEHSGTWKLIHDGSGIEFSRGAFNSIYTYNFSVSAEELILYDSGSKIFFTRE